MQTAGESAGEPLRMDDRYRIGISGSYGGINLAILQGSLAQLRAELPVESAIRPIGPAVAAALQFDCPVWTEDQDVFGSGVATWTTATVEIVLCGD